MATGEHQPSLYGVLYNALTDPKLIGDLLRHPEFRRQAGDICERIAGPAGGEELLRKVCLLAAERMSHLDPDSIRGEEAFFNWFSQLARRVHLSRALSAAAVRSCTDRAARWPDAVADVPSDDMGRFLAHADSCPYHTRRLREDDERLRAIFRQARALDRQGRALRGAELRESITEHERRLRNWREASLKKGGLFGHVALFNDGKEIASCGKFYDFSKHVSRNELDPYAGLQIRGVTSDDPDEEVLLGFYALAGVRHGVKEQTLELDNGYTVGLKVVKVTETTFDIHFRCVETGTLEAGNAGGVIETPGDEEFDGPPDDPTHAMPFPPDGAAPPGSAGWWMHSRSLQAATLFTLMVVVALPCLLLGKTWGQRAAADRLLAPVQEALMSPLLLQTPTVADEEPNPPPRTRRQRDSELKTNASRSTRRDSRRTVRPRNPPARRANGRGTRSAGTSQEDMAVLLRALPRIYAGTSAASSAPRRAPGETAGRGPEFIGVDDQRSTPPRLLSYESRADTYKRARRARANTSVQHASYENRNYSADNSVLHFATNDTLVKKIDSALRELGLQVDPVTGLRLKPAAGQNPETPKYRVVWVARSTNSVWAKSSVVIKLDVYIFRGHERNSADQFSYVGEGASTDAAYDKAVRSAGKRFIDWVKKDSGRPLNAPARETASAEQPPLDDREDAEMLGAQTYDDVAPHERSEPGPESNATGLAPSAYTGYYVGPK